MMWLFHKVIVLQIIQVLSHNLTRPSLDVFRPFGLIGRACPIIIKPGIVAVGYILDLLTVEIANNLTNFLSVFSINCMEASIQSCRKALKRLVSIYRNKPFKYSVHCFFYFFVAIGLIA